MLLHVSVRVILDNFLIWQLFHVIFSSCCLCPFTRLCNLRSLHRRPRGSQSGGEKGARRKFLSTGQRAGYRLSPNYFQNLKRTGSWLGTKNALYYCAQSANSFSWVLLVSSYTRLLSCHTCPVRSPSLCKQGKLLFSTFLTRNEGTTDKSKKRLKSY